MKKLAIIAAVSVLAFAPQAKASDSLIEGAKLCTKHLPRYEREYGIPTHLLAAIASTESGRYHEGLKIRIPWPWTINADGRGYFYPTKAEAVAAAKKFKSHGVQSMDVGCMQVNMYHHGHAFSSLEEAFEPKNNVAYAASFLRNLYESDGSWKKAAADYHSKTPRRGSEYVGQVYNSWYQIIDKLRMAKLQVPQTTIVAMNDMKNSPDVQRIQSATVIQASSPKALPEQTGKKVKSYQSPRMNSIKVSKKETATKENGVIIVRPEIKVVDAEDTSKVTAAFIQPASLTLAQGPEATELSNTVPRILNIGELSPSAGGNNKKTGPTFIFND
jgi:hypothetical protein